MAKEDYWLENEISQGARPGNLKSNQELSHNDGAMFWFVLFQRDKMVSSSHFMPLKRFPFTFSRCLFNARKQKLYLYSSSLLC